MQVVEPMRLPTDMDVYRIARLHDRFPCTYNAFRTAAACWLRRCGAVAKQLSPPFESRRDQKTDYASRRRRAALMPISPKPAESSSTDDGSGTGA